MLVLSRRVGEEIIINSTTRIRVVAISGIRVRLGVTAPGLRIVRSEVLDRPLTPKPPKPTPTGDGEIKIHL